MQWLVMFKEGVSEHAGNATLGATGATGHVIVRDHRPFVNGCVVELTSAQASALKAHRNVVSDVTPNGAIRLHDDIGISISPGAEPPAEYKRNWGIERLEIFDIHQAGFKGTREVLVHIWDTGEPDHKQIISDGAWNTREDGKDEKDRNGHASHCAGIGCAQPDEQFLAGVAPGVKVQFVRVFSSSGSGQWGDVAEAAQISYEHGADIVSFSGGGSSHPGELVEASMQKLATQCQIFAAMGNNGAGSQRGIYPAVFPFVNGIGASARNDGRPSFSSQDTRILCAAPGDTMWSLWLNQGERQARGTSMACPFAAFIAALAKQKGIDDFAEIVPICCDRPTGWNGHNHDNGWGILNPQMVLEMIPRQEPWEGPPDKPQVPAEMMFDCTGTRDPDGTLEYVRLDYGDGNASVSSRGFRRAHRPKRAGSLVAKLTVRDNQDETVVKEYPYEVPLEEGPPNGNEPPIPDLKISRHR